MGHYLFTVYIDLDVKIKCVMYFGGIGANNSSHGLAGQTVLVRMGSQSMLEDGHTWKNLNVLLVPFSVLLLFWLLTLL